MFSVQPILNLTAPPWNANCFFNNAVSKELNKHHLPLHFGETKVNLNKIGT